MTRSRRPRPFTLPLAAELHYDPDRPAAPPVLALWGGAFAVDLDLTRPEEIDRAAAELEALAARLRWLRQLATDTSTAPAKEVDPDAS